MLPDGYIFAFVLLHHVGAQAWNVRRDGGDIAENPTVSEKLLGHFQLARGGHLHEYRAGKQRGNRFRQRSAVAPDEYSIASQTEFPIQMHRVLVVARIVQLEAAVDEQRQGSLSQ